MLATFRETGASLRDLKYGKQILKKTVGQALWYWTRYLLFFGLIFLGLAIAALTYYTPQLPKLLDENLPDIELGVKNGKVVTNVPQPYIQTDGKFALIIDTQGTPSELDKYPTGILILADQIIAKSETESKTMSAKEFEGMHVNRQVMVNWTKTHTGQLWIIGLLVLIVAAAAILGFYWFTHLLGFLLWAVGVWLAGIILKKPLDYRGALKITIYASVLPLLISVVTMFGSNQTLALLSLAAFLFYVLAWIYNLQSKTK